MKWSTWTTLSFFGLSSFSVYFYPPLRVTLPWFSPNTASLPSERYSVWFALLFWMNYCSKTPIPTIPFSESWPLLPVRFPFFNGRDWLWGAFFHLLEKNGDGDHQCDRILLNCVMDWCSRGFSLIFGHWPSDFDLAIKIKNGDIIFHEDGDAFVVYLIFIVVLIYYG